MLIIKQSGWIRKVQIYQKKPTMDRECADKFVY